MKIDSRRTDWLIAVIFFLAALAIRLPEFMQIPRLSDEGLEALWGLDIALGKHFPLSGFTPQYGPIFPYLMAVLFRVFGTPLELPRLTTTVFGALTVAMTYALGRVVQSRAVGAIAAAFALTCPALIVFGHNGWSASLAPFFATATFAALSAGMLKEKSWLVTASGLLAALTIQAHPATTVMLVGIALWFFRLPNWKERIQRADIFLAVMLFLLGCAPMLITWTKIFLNPAAEKISGIFAPTLSPIEYFSRLISLLRVGGFFLGGGIGDPTWLMRLQAIVVELLLIAGVAWAWRLKRSLIPLTLVTSILILPAFILEFNERYYLFLFPLAFVAIGICVEGIWRAARDASTRWVAASPIVFAGLRLSAAALIVALISIPVATLTAFYGDSYANGRTNQEYFRFLDLVRQNQMCGESFFVEDAPRDFSTPITIQSWYSLHALDFLLTFNRCAHTMIPRESITRAVLDRGAGLAISEPSFVLIPSRERFDPVATVDPPMIETQSVKIFLVRVAR